MNELVQDKSFRRKEMLWVHLSFIPLFGFLSFFVMYDRTGRKQYRLAGLIYGMLSLLTIVVFLLTGYGGKNDLFYRLYNNGVISYAFYNNWLARLPVQSVFFAFVLFVVWGVHAHAVSKVYLQFRAIRVHKEEKSDNPYYADRRFRRHAGSYVFWAFFPLLGGITQIYAGTRLKERKKTVLGFVLLGCTAIGVIIKILVLNYLIQHGRNYNIYSFIFRFLIYPDLFWVLRENLLLAYIFIAVYHGVLFFCWGVNLFLTFASRDSVVRRDAEEVLQDAAVYPQMADYSWRRRESLYRVWTFIPVIGGVGLVRGGLRSGCKGSTRRGVLLLILGFLPLIGGILVRQEAIRQNNYHYFRDYAQFVVALYFVGYVVWAVCVLSGRIFQRRILQGIAQSLGSFSSRTEQELAAAQRRYQSSENASEGALLQESLRRRAEVRRHQMDEEEEETEILFVQNADAVRPDTGRRTQDLQWDAGSRTQGLQRDAGRRTQDLQRDAGSRAQRLQQDSASEGRIDLNSCSEESLLKLPGVDLSTAKRAVQYREENGPFRSVDEFVDLFQIKPHFAVQLFEIAAAEIPEGKGHAEAAGAVQRIREGNSDPEREAGGEAAERKVRRVIDI